MDPDSLEAVLEYLNQNDVTDERIYATLAPINTARLQSLLNRFNIPEPLQHHCDRQISRERQASKEEDNLGRTTAPRKGALL